MSSSVMEWLKILRSQVENYDDYVQSCVRMEEQPPYENIWEGGIGTGGGDFDLKFGKVCRLSVIFGDSVEKLQVLPMVFQNLDLDVSDDVVMWRRELRHDYCTEEDNLLESEDLIDEFKDSRVNDGTNQRTKPSNFPVGDDDGGVEVRSKPSIHRHDHERPKTFTSPTTCKEIVEIKGPFNLEISNEKHLKVQNNEKLILKDGFLRLYTSGDQLPNIVKAPVDFKKGAKPLNKFSVELLDTLNTPYVFEFPSPKDAKQFMDANRTPSFNEKTSIRSRLLRLLGKRSSRDLLESKGILRDEAIFGNKLQNLSEGVPEFVKRIVGLIEEKDNIRSLGLYRASANLAVMQKIRFEVDCGRLDILEQYKRDVDVLAGSLKLFFRELKESLIPYDVYRKLQHTIMETHPIDRTDIIKIIATLPKVNKETLMFILRHLLNVCEHKEENKMDIHNMAVSWGPSLISIPDNCADLVVQTTQFYKITEFLLNFYHSEWEKSIKEQNLTRIEEQPLKEHVLPDPVYETIQKVTALIESNLSTEGIYRKSGSSAKIEKIVKKLEKRKLNELEKPKYDVHDLCCALKKYLSSLQEPLIPNEAFEQYCRYCDNLVHAKEKLRKIVESIPHKDALTLLLDHIRHVLEYGNKNKMSLRVLTEIWAATLISSEAKKDSRKKFSKFLEDLINLDQNMPDLVPKFVPKFDSMNASRASQYDNLEDVEDVRGEAGILDDKTEKKLR